MRGAPGTHRLLPSSPRAHTVGSPLSTRAAPVTPPFPRACDSRRLPSPPHAGAPFLSPSLASSPVPARSCQVRSTKRPGFYGPLRANLASPCWPSGPLEGTAGRRQCGCHGWPPCQPKMVWRARRAATSTELLRGGRI